jgi:GH15 family glucan-1,4-alpha-glucosidase
MAAAAPLPAGAAIAFEAAPFSPPFPRNREKTAAPHAIALRAEEGGLGASSSSTLTAMRIEDYALIGDCETAALVGRDGSIDWLCWPRFDSPACFAALLGSHDHGHWLIQPKDSSVRVVRRYRPNTLILETRFETPDGAATLIDFMPPRGRHSAIIRMVVGERGQVPMMTKLVFRFGYGAIVPWMTRLEDGTYRAIAGPDMVVLRTPVQLIGLNLTTVGTFIVAAGEAIPFELIYSSSHLPPPVSRDPTGALEATEAFWRSWTAKCSAEGPWHEAVMRSLITLKALTYAPTGGIVAAPTTSLPEHPGGPRNWDYRFCWLRDATMTLLAMMHAGIHWEAQAWRDWMVRAVAGSAHQIQPLYGISGERQLNEWVVPWLPGFANSKPVRVGNAAHLQFQLDVFGEVMDALHQARRTGLTTSESGWQVQIGLLGQLARVWSEPDEGIWEVRAGRRHFTYSKVMAWLAFDRAIRSAQTFGLEGPVDQWRKLRAQICAEVCERGFDPQLDSFVQSYGSKQVDASLLLLPSVGFLPVSDPRISGTITEIERRLLVDGFVTRYETSDPIDGLPPGEGVFLACSFWLVDAYVLQGRRRDAEQLFRRLIGLRNDVGLLSEEYDPATQRLVGNFPQAFSHVGLINSAFNLTRTVMPSEQRSHQATGAPA